MFFAKQIDRFGFKGTKIYNPFEGQIDTGNMMQALLKCLRANILILNQQTVTSIFEKIGSVEVGWEILALAQKKFYCD
jgi:hypothetical protein